MAVENVTEVGARTHQAPPRELSSDISEAEMSQQEAGAWQRPRRMVDRVRVDEQTMAQFLGWFSIGLGLAEVTVPKAFDRTIGVQERQWLTRMMGLREMATGVGLLTQKRKAPWLWARVAGDILDLALLGVAARASDARRGRIATAASAVAGITALDIYYAQQFTRSEPAELARVQVKKSITINRPAEELYRFWRHFENLPRFMRHLESVSVIDDKHSHWVAKAPAGMTVEWDSEIVEDRPNELLAWRSLEKSQIENFGAVRFEPALGNRGTVVHIDMQYKPPAGTLGATIAKLSGEEPQLQVQEDLQRFKQLLETGVIATTTGQSHGRRSMLGKVISRGRS